MIPEKKLSSEPATQHDLEVWGGNLAEQIASIEDKQNEHTQQFSDIKNILASILKMVTYNESKLSPIPQHTEKIQNHEERIEKLEVNVRMLQK